LKSRICLGTETPTISTSLWPNSPHATTETGHSVIMTTHTKKYVIYATELSLLSTKKRKKKTPPCHFMCWMLSNTFASQALFKFANYIHGSCMNTLTSKIGTSTNQTWIQTQQETKIAYECASVLQNSTALILMSAHLHA